MTNENVNVFFKFKSMNWQNFLQGECIKHFAQICVEIEELQQKKDMEPDSPADATLEAADVVKQPQTFDDHRGAAA